LDYEQTKLRSLSLEALAENEPNVGINRCNTLRCYPAKVPELIQNCCDYLEKNGTEILQYFCCFFSSKENFVYLSITNCWSISRGCIEETLERSKSLMS
jgi:hypothetical protein